MQKIKIAILIIIVLIFIIFIIQNFNTVTIKLFKWNISLPLAFILTGMYILGMFTGGLLWSNIKKLAKQPEEKMNNRLT